MKLYGVTTTYNCEDLIPYVMPYVCRLGYDKLYVYDDHSTDRTIEILSQYDFIEIRPFSDVKMTDLQVFESLKLDLALNLYSQCFLEAQKTNEIIAMTVTDFDEVIYTNFYTNFKQDLEYNYRGNGYNCFATKMINLLPPSPTLDIKPLLSEKTLAHTLPGMRGTIWKNGGMKPLFFIVNDMSWYYESFGNHRAQFCTLNNKPLKNFDDIGFYYSFHFKFISKTDLIKRQKDYQSGNMMPWSYEATLSELFDNSLFGASFPLEMYFCMKQINGIKGVDEGIYEHKD